MAEKGAWWADAMDGSKKSHLGARPISVKPLSKSEAPEAMTPRARLLRVSGGAGLGATSVAMSPPKYSSAPWVADKAGKKRPRPVETSGVPVPVAGAALVRRDRANPYAAVGAPLFAYACVSRPKGYAPSKSAKTVLGAIAATGGSVESGAGQSGEDRHAVAAKFAGRGEYTLYGVFDGHGGAEGAEWCASEGWVELESRWPKEGEEDLEGVRRAFEEAFEAMDAGVNRVAKRTCCGTTATILVAMGADKVAIGHVGDSLCYLVRDDGSSECLTTAHRCSDVEEKREIVDRGGKVCDDRIDGILQLSRSIGDACFSVSHRPDVQIIERNKWDTIVLCTDGVWDAGDPTDIVQAAKKPTTKSSTFQISSDTWSTRTAAERIIAQAALPAAGLIQDDATALVIDIRIPTTPRTTLTQQPIPKKPKTTHNPTEKSL